MVAHERIGIVGRRRQTDQVEMDSPRERVAVRFGRGLQTFVFEPP